MMYRQTFTVSGTGTFPFDMLRYDHCWPEKEYDAGILGNHFPQTTSIKLCREVQRKNVLPTTERWQSFRWKVTSINTTRI